jgi:hypothetical protein
MNFGVQIGILIIGAILAGMNGLIVYILADLKSWVKEINTDFKSHITDKTLHTECGKVHQ